MRLRKLNRRLPGVLTVSLALWIALLPLISAVHMALVPHVYSTEHRHFHEVVNSGKVDPVKDTGRATACFVAESPAASLTSIEECPLVDLALRQGLVGTQSLFLTPNNCVTQSSLPLPTTNSSWSVLFRAPKHSPPFHTA